MALPKDEDQRIEEPGYRGLAASHAGKERKSKPIKQKKPKHPQIARVYAVLWTRTQGLTKVSKPRKKPPARIK